MDNCQVLSQSRCFVLDFLMILIMFSKLSKSGILQSDETQISFERRTFIGGAVLELVF